MPSDSIAGFLDHAKTNRVLFPDQVEQLMRQPDLPQSDLASLCAYLLEKGVLTRFQSDAIREGRGHDLSFGSYPVIDEIGPCPGGTAYRALHPSLRTPVVLRRFSADAFRPTDSGTDVAKRARAFGTIPHPHLLPLLDAGVFQGQAYAVLDQPTDAADLGSLLKEVGGAMPGFLAAEYGWAVASALRAVHERGGWHGEVRPGLLVVGPLTVKKNADGTTKCRPAPNATVQLAETGLIPLRGPAAADLPAADVLAYLPPERVDGTSSDPRGDIYGLGALLYQLLAGRPPHIADTPAGLLDKVRSAEPDPLSQVRPDVPAVLATFIMRMLAKRPENRPQTALEVEAALAPFCRPGILPTAPQPGIPMAAPVSVVTNVPVFAQAVPVPVAVPLAPPEPDGWGVNPNAFADAQAKSTSDTTQKRRRGLTQKEKSRAKIWIVVGLCLHLTATGMLLAACLGGCISFDSSDPTPTKPDNNNPAPKPVPKQERKRI